MGCIVSLWQKSVLHMRDLLANFTDHGAIQQNVSSGHISMNLFTIRRQQTQHSQPIQSQLHPYVHKYNHNHGHHQATLNRWFVCYEIGAFTTLRVEM